MTTSVALPEEIPGDTRSAFGRTFYVANAMEIFERLAWYGFFTLSSLYFTLPLAEGGLGYSEQQRGLLQGIVPFLLYLLPVFTGALGDRFGYRRMFFIAFLIMTPAYYLLGQVKSFWPFFGVFIAVAVGAAIFKPLVVGTVSRTTDDSNRGLGFGIFYTMVNIGGFLGPVIAGVVRAVSWDLVFAMAAAWIAVNFFLLLGFREPVQKTVGTKPNIAREIVQVLSNGPFVVYLLLMAGFWAMYNQLFITLPLYIRDFVDTRPLADWLQVHWPVIGNAVTGSNGQIGPEFITAFNFGSILLFQILVSRTILRLPIVPVLVVGTLLISSSFLLTGFLAVWGALGMIAAVVLFSIGEMVASPKSQEYIAAVMPKAQAALYMGYYFLSMALGFLLAGILSGWAYQDLAKDMGRPEWMWGLFAMVGLVSALGLLLFNQFLAKKMEGSHT